MALGPVPYNQGHGSAGCAAVPALQGHMPPLPAARTVNIGQGSIMLLREGSVSALLPGLCIAKHDIYLH